MSPIWGDEIKTRIIGAVKSAVPPALKTAWWMIRLTVIVSLTVTLMQYIGVIDWLSDVLNPLFNLFGLPGESALVFISGYFVNIYSAVATAVTLELNLRSITILSVMCLCAHNMIIETAVQKKTGSFGSAYGAFKNYIRHYLRIGFKLAFTCGKYHRTK